MASHVNDGGTVIATPAAMLLGGSPPRRSHPLRTKWKSFVNFFALPIREYYQQPPGIAYRRRRTESFDGSHHWPCPTYTGEVGDDEMVLSQTQDDTIDPLVCTHSDPIEIVQGDRLQEQESDDAQSPEMPQTPPNMSSLPGFNTVASIGSYAEPSPRYEVVDPMSMLDNASPSISSPVRTPVLPDFRSGVTMTRHASTPMSLAGNASPSRPAFPYRRSRATSNATFSSPALFGRTISEPVIATLVRSQYSYPKRGLTAQQLSFLSSVESLGRFGVSQTASNTPNLLDSPALVPPGPDYGFPVAP